MIGKSLTAIVAAATFGLAAASVKGQNSRTLYCEESAEQYENQLEVLYSGLEEGVLGSETDKCLIQSSYGMEENCERYSGQVANSNVLLRDFFIAAEKDPHGNRFLEFIILEPAYLLGNTDEPDQLHIATFSDYGTGQFNSSPYASETFFLDPNLAVDDSINAAIISYDRTRNERGRMAQDLAQPESSFEDSTICRAELSAKALNAFIIDQTPELKDLLDGPSLGFYQPSN